MSNSTTKIAEWSASLVLGGWVLLAGLVLWLPSLDPIVPPKMLALSVWGGVSLVLLLNLFTKKYYALPESKSGNWFYACFLVFLIVGLISGCFAEVPTESVMALAKIGLFFILFLFIKLWLELAPMSRAKMYEVITALMLVLGILGVYQVFLPDHNFPGPKMPSGTFYYRNLFGSALFLGVPFVLITLIRGTRKWKITSIITLILIFCSLALCRSGSAVVAMVLFAPVWWGMFRKASDFKMPRWLSLLTNPWLLFGGLMVAFLLLFIFRFPGGSLKQRYRMAVPTYENIEPHSNSMQERVILWRKTADMIGDHWILGVGPGNWKVEVSKYGLIAIKATYGDRFFMRPHNDWLWVWSEYGILGLLAWIGMFVVAIRKGLRIWRYHGEKRIRQEVASWLYGIFGFMLISFFSYPLDRIFHPFMLMVCFALIFAQRLGPVKPELRKADLSIIPMALGLFFIAWIAREQINVYQELENINSVDLSLEPELASQYYQLAQNPLVQLDPFTAEPIPNGLAGTYLLEGEPEQALLKVEEAEKLNPKHPSVMGMHAQVLLELGKEKQAEQAYLNALEQFPLLQSSRVGLIKLYLSQGRYAQAQVLFENGRFDTERSDHRELFMLIQAGSMN